MKVHELLALPERYCKDAFARNARGHAIHEGNPLDLASTVNHKDAVAWCLIGAIVKCYGPRPTKIYKMLHEAVNGSIQWFNDSLRTTHKDIYDLCLRLDI